MLALSSWRVPLTPAQAADCATIWRMENKLWLFVFAALGGLGGLAAILQYLGVKPQDLLGWPASITFHHGFWLIAALTLSVIATLSSVYGLYFNFRRIKQLEASVPSILVNGIPISGPAAIRAKEDEVTEWKKKYLAENLEKTNFQKEMARAKNRADELEERLTQLEKATLAAEPDMATEQLIDRIVAVGSERDSTDVKITKLSDEIAYDGRGAPTYPLKIRLHLRNDSNVPIDLQMDSFLPDYATLKAFPTEVLQCRMRDVWYPKEHGVGRLALYPGQQFQAWIAPDENRFDKARLESNRGRIGTLVFLANGLKVDLKV